MTVLRDELLEKYRRYAKAFDKIDHYNDEFVRVENEYKERSVEEKKILEDPRQAEGVAFVVAILAVIVSQVIFWIAFKDVRGSGWELRFAVVLCIDVAIFALANIIARLIDLKCYRAAKIQESQKFHKDVLLPIQQRLDELNEEYMKAQGAPEIQEYEKDIPSAYQYREALDFFIKTLETRRADTEKEVFNLYEEHLHQQKLERIEEQKLKEYQDSLVKCPKCGSTKCHIITETKSSGTLFNIGDACCGTIFLGPIGLLCGLCGATHEVTSDTFWVCSDCGKKFKKGGE